MIIYPNNLPQPSANFAGESRSSVVRSESENGLAYQSARYASTVESYSVSWKLSQGEFAVFEEWFNEELKGGCLVFGMMLPLNGTYSTQPCRFVDGKYSVAHVASLYFNVTATVESLQFRTVAISRNQPVPSFMRLKVDPATDQLLSFSHRNSLLIARPLVGNLTTYSVPPPSALAFGIINFGLQNLGAGDVLVTSQNINPVNPDGTQIFPGGLPNVNRTFQSENQRRVLRLEMESGHDRQTAASNTTQVIYSIEWEFSLSEFQTFEDFFYVTLKGGTLPFIVNLPVNSNFISTEVRIVDAKYSQSYVIPDRFKVSIKVEKVILQSVVVSPLKPYGVFYSPEVYIYRNTRLTLLDNKKFFIVTPLLGQTISLHISNLQIEIGILKNGPGNLLITRGPFFHSIYASKDFAVGGYFKPSFILELAVKNVEVLQKDFASSNYSKPTFELVTVVEDLGSLVKDTSTGSYSKPTFEVKIVLEDLGSLVKDTSTGSYSKPSFELIII